MGKRIHILVVEDDNDINELLCGIIRKKGYIPQPAYSGTEAMLYIQNRGWDMLLLDLMLPGMTGDEILEKVSEHTTCPILIISAKLEQQTKIDALRTGADDYITKPFDIGEVSARIDSHLRRYQKMSNISIKTELTHKDLTIDTKAKLVQVNNQILTLTAREYAILELLISSPKKVFTKANVFESVWKEQFHGDDNTINVHMSNLRNKLVKANRYEEYIETIWGVGYRLKT